MRALDWFVLLRFVHPCNHANFTLWIFWKVGKLIVFTPRFDVADSFLFCGFSSFSLLVSVGFGLRFGVCWTECPPRMSPR